MTARSIDIVKASPMSY